MSGRSTKKTRDKCVGTYPCDPTKGKVIIARPYTPVIMDHKDPLIVNVVDLTPIRETKKQKKQNSLQVPRKTNPVQAPEKPAENARSTPQKKASPVQGLGKPVEREMSMPSLVKTPSPSRGPPNGETTSRPLPRKEMVTKPSTLPTRTATSKEVNYDSLLVKTAREKVYDPRGDAQRIGPKIRSVVSIPAKKPNSDYNPYERKRTNPYKVDCQYKHPKTEKTRMDQPRENEPGPAANQESNPPETFKMEPIDLETDLQLSDSEEENYD